MDALGATARIDFSNQAIILILNIRRYMKVLSAILLLILTTVLFLKTQVSCNNELRFKKWLVDTLLQVTDSFEVQDDSLAFIIKEHHFIKSEEERLMKLWLQLLPPC